MSIYVYDLLGVLTGPVTFPETPGIGVQLPGNALELNDLAAPAPGSVWAFLNGEVVQVVDQRGTVYSTLTGSAEEWGQLGELPAEYTTTPCPGVYYTWDGGEWKLNAGAVAQDQRNQLMAAANQATAGMANAYIAGLLDDADTATFKAFAAYQLALSKIEQQPGYPATIVWPPAP
jgi:hypothetical protein